jgi:CIC family chloride channel protein
MGLPVGLIAPILVIGAVYGSVLGHMGNFLSPDSSSEGLYIMLGMTAMMAATLHAPLAALATVLELTGNPNIILPAMLIIVIAIMTTRHVFRKRSVFLTTLSTLGLEYRLDPASQNLSRAGVASIMERQFMQLRELAGTAEITEILSQPSQWIVFGDESGSVRSLLNSIDLNNHLETFGDTEITLVDLTSDRKNAGLIDIRATLYEAYKQLKDADVEAACVYDTVASSVISVIGILTRESIIEDYIGHGAG